jgi:acetyl esterase/lipase
MAWPVVTGHLALGAQAPVIDLWPGNVPGEAGQIGEERDTTKDSDELVAGRRLIRLGNVSRPTITVYKPEAFKDTGASVLVCPGGGYNILALDLEGTEVCEWLNSIGVTGLLLKYRVPKRSGQEKHTAALQDAQRALGLVRFRARDLGLDPQRIGVLGFSAGGHLAASLSNNFLQRTHAKVDPADEVSCRPDFAVLVYPAYLTVKEENDRVASDLNISSNVPPTFMVMAQDDPVRVENVLFYSAALHKARVPLELHIYPKGGHGYGLRPTDRSVTLWPQPVAAWMRGLGVIPSR